MPLTLTLTLALLDQEAAEDGSDLDSEEEEGSVNGLVATMEKVGSTFERTNQLDNQYTHPRAPLLPHPYPATAGPGRKCANRGFGYPPLVRKHTRGYGQGKGTPFGRQHLKSTETLQFRRWLCGT